ncbi:MAG: AmmeMemoRadiSam system radical SAM enzyme [Actinobacteria bacterium]|nr:AmmeMemoRadiSam system radical SAM enzyme [Actinomycetota bacterium]MCL6088440.1 AmmeMemoRadiSam system radical SAM enzyme [Actinomycetota bacterium]
MKECYLYKTLNDFKIRCDLCNHRCLIENGNVGKCCVRKNTDGKLYSLVYGRLIAENVDPIEKKPLFHFLPGTNSYSIATVGCNFRCFFCQNYQISQMPADDNVIDGRYESPENIVKNAVKFKCKSISYTYTEPTIYFELAYDTSIIAKENGLKNVFVTNGFMTREALDMISPYLDAANVDLKSFSDEFYKNRLGGRLKPVLNNIKYMKELGIWIEVTTLLIPGLNDSKEELTQIAEFLKETGIEIPWHISAYYPQYKSTIPPTLTEKIVEAVNIGKAQGLKYVYGGNVPFSSLEDTVCPGCGSDVIKRRGFSITKNDVQNSLCEKCSFKIDGVF